jgi:hypothetical protein
LQEFFVSVVVRAGNLGYCGRIRFKVYSTTQRLGSI